MNPLNNFNFSKGVDSIKQRLMSPFNNYLSAEERKALLKAAHERHDFKSGFIITPINKDGKELESDVVRLVSDAMPHDSLDFGGQQKLVKNYYPGSSEPTVQVLGPQENDITIRGRFKAKKLKESSDATFDRELWRKYPQALQEQVEAIRIAGLLVKITLGEEWQRYGFISEAAFKMKTLADIDYQITFLVVGFNQPKDFIIVTKQQTIPYNQNRALAQYISTVLEFQSDVPASMPQSFADQINAAISDVAAAVNLVTGFVDTVLGEVEALKSSVQRALGLIKNARNKISGYQRSIGGQQPEAGVSKVTSISGATLNAQHVAKVSDGMFNLNALLASLAVQLRNVSLTIPLARHRVQSGDTLQGLAMKYYNDSSQWEKIFDHNKLASVDLTLGVVLEIPRV
jgi:nucleoid-associated protein YgaU